MNRQSIYENSVNDLLKAYNTGTLQHGDLTKCATATILRRSSKELGVEEGSWAAAFLTQREEDTLKLTPQLITKEGEIIGIEEEFMGPFPISEKRVIRKLSDIPSDQQAEAQKTYKECNDLIAKSGYTKSELANIEYTFEAARQSKNPIEWVWTGLTDVLEVLKTIHEVDNATHKVTLSKFVKNPDYKVVDMEDLESEDEMRMSTEHFHRME